MLLQLGEWIRPLTKAVWTHDGVVVTAEAGAGGGKPP